MNDPTFPMQFVFNEAIHIQWVMFLAYTLERRFSKLKTALWLTVLCVLAFFVPMYFASHSAVRQLSVPLMYFAAAFALFRSRFARTVFCTMIPALATILCEVLVMLVLPEAYTNNYDQNRLWTYSEIARLAPAYIALYSAIIWLSAAMLSRVKYRLTTRQWLVFLLFPLSQSLAVSMIITLTFRAAPEALDIILIVAILIISIAADFALLRNMSDAAKNAELKARNSMLEKQLELQLAHYKALGRQYEVNRCLRHDIMHHVHTIQLLLENGRQQEATEYADSLLEEHAAVSRLGSCENPVVDAFLFERIESAQRRGIAVTSRIVIPAELPINSTDLIIVFGNLMDNAEEACADCAEPRIELCAYIEKGFLVISEENNFSESAAADKQRRIPELERGVGMHILASVAEKYHGRFTHEKTDDIFSAAVYLALS